MGTRETQFLRRLERDEPRLQTRLRAVWALFTALKRALLQALEQGDEARARALAEQIRALIAGHQSSPRRLVLKSPKPGQAMRPGGGLVILTDKSRTKPGLAVRNGKLNQAPRPAPRQAIRIPSITGGGSPGGGTVRLLPSAGTSATPRITILTHDASHANTQPRLGKGFAADHGFAYIGQAGSQAFDDLIAQAARPGRRELAFKVELSNLELATPDIPADDTPPNPPPPVDFQLRLEGAGARGSAVALGGEADLVFFLGALRADSLATASGARLDAAIESGGTLGVMLVPVGYDLRDGAPCRQTAQLVARQLKPELRFPLQAGRLANPAAGAWAYLDLDGVQLGSFFLEVPVVAANASVVLPATPRHIDLDSDGQPVGAQLVFRGKGGALNVSYANSASGFSDVRTLGTLAPASVEQAVAAFKASVDSVPGDALWSYLTDPFQQPPTPNQQKSLDGMFLTIARAGWDLWTSLTADPDLADFLHDINSLPFNSRVAVVTDSVFIPWEMIYPENPDAQAVKPALLWGARYLFHTTLPEDRNLIRDKKAHLAAAPGASLCVNPAIDNDFAGVSPLPAASHHAWAAQARQQHIPCDEADPASARALLLGNATEPARKWIYLFCHGLGGAGNAIDLGGTPPNLIKPASLAGTPPFDGRPIVFLNSCGSGAHSALTLTNFYTAFRRDKQALGLVATSCPVPATTAAAIGQRISSLYLDGSHDLASAVHTARCELMARHIPIGLFYTVHAPGDVRARA
jgi:hypothetical protein